MSQVAVPEMMVPVVIGMNHMVALPRRFSSGSCGWYLSQKVELEGERVQISLSVVVIGSKPTATKEEAKTQEQIPPTPETIPVGPKPSEDGKRVKGRSKSVERV